MIMAVLPAYIDLCGTFMKTLQGKKRTEGPLELKSQKPCVIMWVLVLNSFPWKNSKGSEQLNSLSKSRRDFLYIFLIVGPGSFRSFPDD